MDDVEALELLESKLGEYRARSYPELKLLIGTIDAGELVGRAGARYQFEIEPRWDGKPNQSIRVIGAIDDGRGWRSISPLCSGFIMAPDGSFIGDT